MKEETVIAVISSNGVFQINTMSYRNEKTVKLLKKMVKDGKIVRQRINARLSNYFMKSK